MADNSLIRWRGGGGAAFVQELTRHKEEVKGEFFDLIEAAGRAGHDRTKEVAATRIGRSGFMHSSVAFESHRGSDKIKFSWGWLSRRPRYTWFQEFGTYGNHIEPRLDFADSHHVPQGPSGIWPMESLARGLYAATNHIAKARFGNG